MRPLLRSLLVLFTLVGLVAGALPTAAAAPSRVRPLAQAHAHNDYEHDRPLFDALSHGFTSVEADIYLVDGQLLVAHDPEDLDPARTLRSLYLEPLRERFRYGLVDEFQDTSFAQLALIRRLMAPANSDAGQCRKRGHEDPFPPLWLNVRCVIRHGTFAETNAMGEMRRKRK